jgi:DNA invertase Pin-like site-specific DNA recombinase
MNTIKLRVGIYSRISTTDQEVTNQLVQLREFAERQGWQVISEFVDEGQSGSKAGSQRPQFSRMMEDASQKKFDLLLFWSLDRLSREGVSATLHYLQQLNSWSVQYRSFTEPYLDSLGIFRDAILALLATLARQERVRISERTKAGLERVRRQGRKLGRPTVSQSIIEQIRSLRASGMTVRNVARQCAVSTGFVCKVI